jgi:hypothetical protein
MFLQFLRFFRLSVRGSQKGVKKIFEKFSCFFLLNSIREKKIFFFFQKFGVGPVLGPFGPKKGQRDFFLKNLIRPLFTPYTPLTSCKKSEKSNEAILRKIPKTSFWARFGPFWPKNGQMDFFLKNRAPSVFYTCGPLTSCKNSEKTNEPILRKARHGQTDRLTEAIL